ncbi:MAG TPA: hypothetical protein VN873_18450, partial [Candidatus Angelobacter sp.]|nr:hypothetical protein [Candidatus Angelobacter sp.]
PINSFPRTVGAACSGVGCVRWIGANNWPERCPNRLPASNNKLLPLEKALAFTHGLLCDARKLTHVAYLRRDPLAPELLGIKNIQPF